MLSDQMQMISDFSFRREGGRNNLSCIHCGASSLEINENGRPAMFCENRCQHQRRSLESFLDEVLLPRDDRGDYALNPDNFDLQPLLEADIRPPITQESLSELDVESIIHNPRMRYDLNFDKEASFGPRSGNPGGESKLAKGKVYWRALSVELALYMECASKPSSKCLLRMPLYRQFATRLPHLFTTLYSILKTLTRDDDWPAIDELIDVDMIMQQLRKGICDLVGLNKRLGAILKHSCSPRRDDDVEAAVDRMNNATEKSQPKELSEGLEELFSLLEIMKLVRIAEPFLLLILMCVQDIANHQIRFLRLLMINESTQYVHEHYLKRIQGDPESGPPLSREDLVDARAWYESIMRVWQPQNFEEGEESARLTLGGEEGRIVLFGSAVRDLVRRVGHSSVPISFEYDYNRLKDLRTEYKALLFDRQILDCFRCLLKARGFREDPSQEICRLLLLRISDLGGSIPKPEENMLPAIAIEVARAARGFPSIEDRDFVIERLYPVRESSRVWFQRVEQHLSNDLDKAIKSEIQAIHNLPALYIVNRYQPDHPPPPPPGQSREERRLQALAGRIAHITVLHWRIWGPILIYPSPQHPADANNPEIPGSPPDPGARYVSPSYQSPANNIEGSEGEWNLTSAQNGRAVNDTGT